MPISIARIKMPTGGIQGDVDLSNTTGSNRIVGVIVQNLTGLIWQIFSGAGSKWSLAWTIDVFQVNDRHLYFRNRGGNGTSSIESIVMTALLPEDIWPVNLPRFNWVLENFLC
jgi:hypothetical protein